MTPANPCPICGQPIPERAKGNRHGHPPKTCSESCRKERTRRIEKERYQRVKDSAAWKTTRKNYLAKLRAKLSSDPDFARVFRAEAAARLRDWNARLRREDPARHEQIKAEKRAERMVWRQKLIEDPVAWEAHREKCRAWYQSLSEEERDRIFYEPRRHRARKLKSD
ncbi:hypothetical protein ACFQDN_22140 [Pseudomonas asuensis]|uniref:Uncharacterized protein n=1 Tax=Pseudomonas asuensis TaxID=1825787 RepID=A0ABQ2H1A9_9PSED|nr:hypothetical protein [Pseudomonas asuensis]GGM25844.1 hypothetical protein GCM10009425_40710 [Pseudomonas asuensis]